MPIGLGFVLVGQVLEGGDAPVAAAARRRPSSSSAARSAPCSSVSRSPTSSARGGASRACSSTTRRPPTKIISDHHAAGDQGPPRRHHVARGRGRRHRRSVHAAGPDARRRRHEPQHAAGDARGRERQPRRDSTRRPAKVYEAAGGYAPTIGILGAVLGLIHVMENLSDPNKLGAGIAVAFVATVYGVGSANLLFLPDRGEAARARPARRRSAASWSSRASSPSRKASTRA